LIPRELKTARADAYGSDAPLPGNLWAWCLSPGSKPSIRRENAWCSYAAASGKIYCTTPRAKGAIALDVGSVLDLVPAMVHTPAANTASIPWLKARAEQAFNSLCFTPVASRLGFGQGCVNQS